MPYDMDYDKLAIEYARHRMVHPEVLRDLLITGFLTPLSRVLDVGCGTGNYIVTIESIVGCLCCGLDPSAKMLQSAQKRGRAVNLHLGEAIRLGFASNSFDMLFSVDVIHHLLERQRYISEAYRVLKPKGKFCTVTDSDWIIRNRQPLSNYFPELVDIELRRYPRIAQLRAWMEGVGFHDMVEHTVEFTDDVLDIQEYRERAYSALHLLPEEAFQRGIARMERDLQRGPLRRVSRYILVWGVK